MLDIFNLKSLATVLIGFNATNYMSLWNSFFNQQYHTWFLGKILVLYCLWCIWVTRNNNLFNDKKKDYFVEHTFSLVIEYYILIGLKDKPQADKTTINIKWESPSTGSCKINIDRFILFSLGHGIIRDIIRSYNCNWVIGFTEIVPHARLVLAKLLNFRRGLLIANDNNLSLLKINIDSLDVISLLQNDHRINSNITMNCRFLV